ncbi:cysteine-rich tail protein 1 [Ranitomeya imitator]|uniref:cysteine-rich tail protein 1 n=1 Tax=Ranitomeya imitator TaxID=111125 RepID=UPI0037E88225
MDKGDIIQNPYANVNIPRAQLKSSFIRNTLGEDLDGVVITNPSVVPTYPSHIRQDSYSNNNPYPNSDSNKIRTQESWRRPYNPYGSNKPHNGGHTEAMYNIDLEKHYKEVNVEEKPCCCYPCCKCCPYCRKSCCVIS